MSDHHHHGPSTTGRLAWSAGIFFASFVLQGLGGWWTGSIGLISDSLENLNDVLVNSLGILSLWLANHRDPDDRWTFGWHRLEVFNSLVGVGFLMFLAGAVGWEALARFRHPVPIQTGWVLVFSGIGLVLNILATVVLVPRDRSLLERDANLKAAYLHAFADSLTSVSLVGSMILIRLTGWRWVDPAIALVILLVILRGAVLLLRDAVGILMHRAAFEHEAVKAELMGLPGVLGVEDFRSWKMCSHLTIATAHIIVAADRLGDTEAHLERIEHLLWERHGVRHLTVHFETREMADRHHHRFIHQHDVEDGHHHD
ncbi:cation diffusion facilitator family transporter [Geothrix campi]|uniref:cation diffusion facilitator family transporter n=1 Tax=Geothrix campi TaxID=2966450 RepID=UPI00214745B2|nr:cation diffusion facilitator family transporter [Geothrix sp. SG10]